MSMIRSVLSVAYTVIPPFTPAGTIAALDVTAPVSAFSVDTGGCAVPAGHAVRNPSIPAGATVMLKAYAWALAGIPQELEGTGNVRATPPARDGPLKLPVE